MADKLPLCIYNGETKQLQSGDTILVPTQATNSNNTEGASTAYVDNISYHSAHISIGAWEYSSITQGTWVWSQNGSSQLNGYLLNTGLAQNDQVNYIIGTSAGTYTFGIFWATGTNHGIITVLVDGVSKGTIDGYSSSALFGIISSLTGITFTAGMHTIGLKMATKNASSSSYALTLSSLFLFRTA